MGNLVVETTSARVRLNGGMSASASDLTQWWPELPGLSLELCLDLQVAYAEPTRGYHDTRHLSDVFSRLDELWSAGAGFAREPVLLAAWFHDAVYDGRPDAEERSARWAESALPPLPPALVTEVARLVRLTEGHRPEAGDLNGAALVDADLAILAAPPERYAEYVATVRQEYAAVPDADFAAGRAAILEDLLAKPTLFHTAYAHEHWEVVARANVEAEIGRLRG